MIVDIGPRQSGKTTRLLQDMTQFLVDNPDKSTLLVSKNNNLRREFKKKVSDICGDCKHRVITSYKMLPPSPNNTFKQYVDEFGLMSSDNLVLDHNAYYNSSYNPDYDPWPEPTQSIENYSSKAKEIVDYYNSLDNSNEWKINPKKHINRHEL